MSLTDKAKDRLAKTRLEFSKCSKAELIEHIDDMRHEISALQSILGYLDKGSGVNDQYVRDCIRKFCLNLEHLSEHELKTLRDIGYPV